MRLRMPAPSSASARAARRQQSDILAVQPRDDAAVRLAVRGEEEHQHVLLRVHLLAEDGERRAQVVEGGGRVARGGLRAVDQDQRALLGAEAGVEQRLHALGLLAEDVLLAPAGEGEEIEVVHAGALRRDLAERVVEQKLGRHRDQRHRPERGRGRWCCDFARGFLLLLGRDALALAHRRHRLGLGDLGLGARRALVPPGIDLGQRLLRHGREARGEDKHRKNERAFQTNTHGRGTLAEGMGKFEGHHFWNTKKAPPAMSAKPTA